MHENIATSLQVLSPLQCLEHECFLLFGCNLVFLLYSVLTICLFYPSVGFFTRF